MTLLADASALVSMIAGEADADELASRRARHERRLCSAVPLWKTVAASCNSYRSPVLRARQTVRSFAAQARLDTVPIGDDFTSIDTQSA